MDNTNLYIKRIERRHFSWLVQTHLALQGIQTGDIHVVDIAEHVDRSRSVNFESNRHLLGSKVHVQATLRVSCA